MNKRGDVSDGIMFLVIIFFLAVSFIVVIFINSKLSYVISSTPLNETDAANTIVDSLDRITTTGAQRAFVFIFAFMIVGMMVSAFLVRVHPIWIFLYIFFAAIAVLLAAILANIYNEVILNENLSEIADQQTMMNWIMQHLVQIVIGAVGLSMIILFAKPPSGGEPI